MARTFDESQHSRDPRGKFSAHVGAEQEGSLTDELEDEPSGRFVDLQEGDEFFHYVKSDQTVKMTVLRDERKEWTDFFGRSQLAVWVRREDTGAEGWYPYGPNGRCHLKAHVGAEQEDSLTDGDGMDRETGLQYMAAAAALRDPRQDPSLTIENAVCGTYGKDVASTASDAIEELAAGGYLEDRMSDAEVAPILAQKLHKVLVQDPDASFRSEVSHDDSTDPDTLAELADDPDVDVRAGVAWNRNADEHTLRKLVDDENPVVGSHARRQLDLRNPTGWQ